MWFNGYYFGTDVPVYGFYRQSIRRIPLGLTVRGQIAKSVIFQVVRGNGYYGSIQGKAYQTIKKYFVPSNINNTESEPYRRVWKAAVLHWQNALTTAEKTAYHRRASNGLRMTGFNYFMRLAMKGKISMFVDRGDPASSDFSKGDLTTDNSWHDLDLSAIVAKGAASVLLQVRVEGPDANKRIGFRKNGNANNWNAGFARIIQTAYREDYDLVIPCDANRVIEYRAHNIVWTTIEITVKGWWT